MTKATGNCVREAGARVRERSQGVEVPRASRLRKLFVFRNPCMSAKKGKQTLSPQSGTSGNRSPGSLPIVAKSDAMGLRVPPDTGRLEDALAWSRGSRWVTFNVSAEEIA